MQRKWRVTLVTLKRHSVSRTFSACEENYSKMLSHQTDVIGIPDSKAEADHHMWEFEFNRRIRGPGKRGRAPISMTDLAKEFDVKAENFQRMNQTLKDLQGRVSEDILEDSDLDEYEELLNSDMECSETDSENGKQQ